MNPEAEAILKKILAKDINALTTHDIEFLKARWSYVGKNSREKFKSIFKTKEVKAEKKEPTLDELEKSATPENPFKEESDGEVE